VYWKQDFKTGKGIKPGVAYVRTRDEALSVIESLKRFLEKC
jgi:hypothetical protein